MAVAGSMFLPVFDSTLPLSQLLYDNEASHPDIDMTVSRNDQA
jgi:hypothetical protein